MSNWVLFESPITIIVVTLALLIVLAALLVQTGRRGFLVAVAAVVVAGIGLLGAERWVITESEQVRAMLHQVARDLEANQPQLVLDHCWPQATSLRQYLQSIMPQVTIHHASIKRNLRVEIQQAGSEMTAEARANGVVQFSHQNGLIANQMYARFFVIRLRKQDGRWYLVEYDDYDPLQSMRKESPAK